MFFQPKSCYPSLLSSGQVCESHSPVGQSSDKAGCDKEPVVHRLLTQVTNPMVFAWGVTYPNPIVTSPILLFLQSLLPKTVSLLFGHPNSTDTPHVDRTKGRFPANRFAHQLRSRRCWGGWTLWKSDWTTWMAGWVATWPKTTSWTVQDVARE